MSNEEILDALEAELDARLERQPSAKDRLAIRTALAKAIARAQGAELPGAGAEVDLWAEKYEGTSSAPAERPPDVGTAVRDLADALGNAVASAGEQLAKALRGSDDR